MSAKLLSENFRLLGNYPNPFNQTTRIQFFLKQSSTVKIEIFDVRGLLIRQYDEKIILQGIIQYFGTVKANWEPV